jgi:putative glycosyltransferase (TIGR04348 family)
MSASDSKSRPALRSCGESSECEAAPLRAGAARAGNESGAESEAKSVVLKSGGRQSIVVVSPAMREANNGNWHTAHRWSKFLSTHCDTALVKSWPTAGVSPAAATAPQAMIALHARRSADSIHAWAKHCPGKPLIVVLTGTDLYRDIQHDAVAQQSLALATHLVVLQEDGLQAVPDQWRSKTQVIFQSAPGLKPAWKASQRFRAVMVGHLRSEKDPLTFMKAALQLGKEKIHLDQIGDALEATFAVQAKETQRQNPHYHWLGGLPRAVTRQRIKRAHVLVNCSMMEGGAQVILEAVQSDTPVLASRISGNVGMLGADYAGYFPVGDAAALAALLRRCAAEPEFLALLKGQCARRAPLFAPAAEERHVLNLVLSAINPPSAQTPHHRG